MDAFEGLRSAVLLEGIPEADLRGSARLLRRIELRNGERLWSEGDEAEHVFLLAEGSILISRTGPEGQQLIIKIYLEGEILGKVDALAGASRLSDATAATAAVCFAMPVETLQNLADRHSVVARRLMRELSETSRAQLETTTDLAFLNIKARVARKLLELAGSGGLGVPKGDWIEIGVSLSQGQLAAMVAASRANVNRALAVLVADGLVEHRRGRFTVVRRDGLMAAATSGA